MTILNLMTGILLLFAGRRLFWLSVACIGFIAAYHYAVTTGIPGPAWITWVMPLGIGLAGAVLALVYQKFAVVLVGFMIGGWIVTDLVSLLGIHGNSLAWLIFLAGGLAGAVAMLIVFDWALIVLSSLAGAFVIIPSMGLDRIGGDIAFAGLTVLGIIVQAVFFLRTRNKSNLS
jgi:hypothetical protein